MTKTNDPHAPTAAGDQERLDRLIDEYEMRLEDGEDVSPADICRGNTELIPAFLARLEEVTAANLTLSALAQSASQPEIPGYRIINELGRGGSAIVYRAMQLEMDREVAVKVFFPQLQDRGFFRREIAVIKRLTHDGIPAIFDCGRLNFGNAVLCWFSMELLAGGAIDRKTVCQRSTAEILQLFRKTVEAVHYAHLNGVLHRDLKSSNILLDETGSPHVADFGIAKLLEDDPESSKRSTVGHMGTPAYTAPELILGQREQPDVRTEVYSLGVLLFEMLTGQHPFGKNARSLARLRKTLTSRTMPSPALLRPDVSVDLDRFVLSLLSIDPRDRYESCVIVLDEIRRLQDGQPIAARRVGLPERTYRWCRIHYLTAAATFAGVTVLLVLLVQLLISDMQLRRYAQQLESQAADLSSADDRRIAFCTNSRLRTVQQTLTADRRLALELLEDEAAFPLNQRKFSWKFLHQRASEHVVELSGTGGGFDRIRQLEFSASGRHLVICSKPYDVSVVDLQTQQRTSVAEDMQIGGTVVLMPDHSGFLCQNQRGEVLLVRLADAQVTDRIVFDEPIRQKMAVTSDGQYLLSLTVDGTVLRYNFASGEVVKSNDRRFETPVTIWISPDDAELNVVSRDASWLTWDIETLYVTRLTSVDFPQNANATNPPRLRAAAANYQTGFGLCLALSFSSGVCAIHWPQAETYSRPPQTRYRTRSSPGTRELRFRFPDQCVLPDLEGGLIFSLVGRAWDRRLRPRTEGITAVAVSP